MNRHGIDGSLVPFLVLSLCGLARAADHCDYWGHLFGRGACVPDCITLRCCDDYCPKPLPCVRGVSCFGCDDYCPKPLPRACGVNCFCCDDYCPKPLPCVRCCPPPVGLTCGPPDRAVRAVPAVRVCKQSAGPARGTSAGPQRQVR